MAIDPEKIREKHERYNKSAKGHARYCKYVREHQVNERRIRIGREFVGYVESVETAAIIKAHIRRRVREFEQTQRATLAVDSDAVRKR